MEKARKFFYLVLCVATVVVMVASLLSVFRNTPNRYLKMLDFPRIQFFLVSLVTLVFFVLLTKRWRWYDYALVIGLLGGLIINGTYLIHYTTLVAKAVPDAAANPASEDCVSLLLINVKMENRQASSVLESVAQKDPDFVLVMEVDSWWNEQLVPLDQTYPYKQQQINEVAYGMSLYSKFPLQHTEMNDLNNEKVPSFAATVTLTNGREIRLHCVHPVPPKYFSEYPDNQGNQEVALHKVGEMIMASSLPNLLAGDLNDVVWGYTNELTETKDLLHDVRVGRGFYNTFDATKWWMRWPLDHVFVTDQFKLKSLERLPAGGSDHFPIYVELVLE